MEQNQPVDKIILYSAPSDFFWRKMDGETPFESIVGTMQEHFGPKADPAPERLQKFLTILYRDKFVQLFAPVK